MGENVESSGPNERHEAKAVGADEPVNDALKQTRETDLTKIFKQVKVRETMQSPSAPAASNDSRGAAGLSSPSTSQRASEGQGFTQIFQPLEANTASSAAGPVPPRRGAQHQHHSSSRPAATPSQAIEGAGEFTRIFQRPDDPRSRTAGSTQRDFYESPALPPQQLDGDFTQLLRRLSDEDNDEESMDLPAPMAQLLPKGPGEFTRIASRSALRGAADREKQVSALQGDKPSDRDAYPQAAPVGPRQFIANGQPLSSMAGVGGPGSLPLGQAMSAVMPLSAPDIASPALHSHPQLQSGSKLQQYIPLLLIANLFTLFLLLTLVALMLLLRHR